MPFTRYPTGWFVVTWPHEFAPGEIQPRPGGRDLLERARDMTLRTVDVPGRVTVFPREVFRPSRRSAEQRFPQLVYWSEVERGSHFVAFERPEIVGRGSQVIPWTAAVAAAEEVAALDALESAIPWVAEHTRKYVETNGEEGYLWNGAPTLVLTTTGRRSGQLRRNALIYGRDGDDYIVVASRGGAPAHPLWYRNIEADPTIYVQIRAEHFPARARTATPRERRRLWSVMTTLWPDYDTYQAKTEREIPVVVLTPLSEGAGEPGTADRERT